MSSMAGFHTLKHLPEEKISDKISRRVLIGDKTYWRGHLRINP